MNQAELKEQWPSILKAAGREEATYIEPSLGTGGNLELIGDETFTMLLIPETAEASEIVAALQDRTKNKTYEIVPPPPEPKPKVEPKES